MSVKRAGFHVTGPLNGSLGASFVAADFQVRVLNPFGLVDGPSDCLYVHIIPLTGCMDRRSS